mgnify:CR=1 FL=1
MGNVVCYQLRGCEGCLCHEYDHIVPFSRGGRTEISNCQVLQTRPNRLKGNDDNDEKALRAYSCWRTWTREELDVVEMAIFGGLRKDDGWECRCKSVMEMMDAMRVYHKGNPRKDKYKLPNCP